MMATLLLTAATAFLVGSADVRYAQLPRRLAGPLRRRVRIAHAVQVVNGIGIINFENEVAANWVTVFGNGTKTFGPIAGYTYQVAAIADAGDPANWSLRVDGQRPEACNVVVARIERENIPNTAPGALSPQDNLTDVVFGRQLLHGQRQRHQLPAARA
jgi:hypothetical protein